MNYIPYAGIGSRQTPVEVMQLMTNIGEVLEENGFTLRSGGAGGADLAFERGVKSQKEIFIPWNGFNQRYVTQPGIYAGWPSSELGVRAMELASKFHPNWNACSNGAKQLHSRNMAQVFGLELNSPSKFVVCWTPNASGSGGTGQALRIAKSLGIPIFDLGKNTADVAGALQLYCESLVMPEIADPQ